MLGGWFLSPMFGAGTINSNDFSIAGLGLSLLGAVILLAIVNLVRRGSVRLRAARLAPGPLGAFGAPVGCGLERKAPSGAFSFPARVR